MGGELHFNLSHTDKIAALAVAFDIEVGVDIEEFLPLCPDSLTQVFSITERQQLSRLTGTDRLLSVYNGWTRKEALLKAEGIGLSLRMDRIPVTLAPGEAPALLGHCGEGRLDRHWNLTALRPGARFVGALATSKRPRAINYYCFDSSECEV